MLTSLPLEHWPDADRAAWRSALKPRCGWRPGGALTRYRPVTVADLRKRYGYFLQFCFEDGRFDTGSVAAGHITETLVEAYVNRVATMWSPVTTHMSIQKLWKVARVLWPGKDYAWLREIVLDLKSVAAPRIKRPFVTAEQLWNVGVALHEEGRAMFGADDRKAIKLLRDGLIVAFLATYPLRAKNFAHLDLGRSIRKEKGAWWIILDRDKTKNGRADMRMIDDVLASLLEAYLRLARPPLMKERAAATSADPSEIKGPLWLSCFGRALDEASLRSITTSVTRKALGIAITPHAFRAAAANSAAWKGSNTPNLASAILQHGDTRITDAHYNRARTFEATQALQKLLREG